MEQPDEIHLQGLSVATRIGVPEEERAQWQTLVADLTLCLPGRCEAMEDQLDRTVNYATVAERVRALAAERPRRLIETLGAELCGMILAEFAVAGVTLELRKRIVPGCDWVAVRLRRDAK